MRTLIAGHSQAKYFHQFLKSDSDIDVISRSGYRVEDMWDVIKDVVGGYRTVALLLGANNLPDDSTSTLLTKLDKLVEQIRVVSPRCIFFSQSSSVHFIDQI